MLKVRGLETSRDWAILGSVILLIVLTPLGKEATHPGVFLAYRTLLFLLTILCAFEWGGTNQSRLSPLFTLGCSAVLLLMLVSMFANSGSRFDGFYRWYQHALFGGAFLAFAAFVRGRPAVWKFTVLWVVIGTTVTYLLVEIALGRRPVIGPFVNPNYFASFLLTGFGAGLAVALFDSDRVRRFAGGAAALFLFYGMTQAFSRGATLAAFLALGVAAFRFRKRLPISFPKMIVGAIALGLVALAASPHLVQKFVDAGESDPYNYMRPKIWMASGRIIAENPILGVGLAQFTHVSKKYAPAVEGVVARFLKRPGIAHSEYLQYTAEIGLPAALLLFGLAGYLVFMAIRRATQCSDEQRVFQEAALLSTAGIGIHALVDNNWSVPVMAAGLLLFALADAVPAGTWSFHAGWSRQKLAVTSMLCLGLYTHSTLLPGAAIYFNESGHQAFLRGDLEAAESAHRIAAAIAPNHHIFLDNTAHVYLAMYRTSGERRHLDFAEDFFLRAAAANPNAEEPRRHLETVLIQKLTGNPLEDTPIHKRIIELDRDILRIDPFNPFIRRNLAEALYNSGRPDEAKQELAKALEYEPNYVPAYLRIADWYKEAGAFSESEMYRQKAFDVTVKYQHVRTEEVYEALLLGRLPTALKEVEPDRGKDVIEQ